MFAGKTILLVMSGGIAAYKTLDLIRRLRERGAIVRVAMTDAAMEFVTPISVGAIAGEAPFTSLWDADSDHDVGHIRLAREADLIIVAPATANILAKMAHGLAPDLATAILLAAEAPVLAAPAMNPTMWSAMPTRRNVAVLTADGVRFVGPEVGEMAEAGEAGMGRMAEPLAILAAAERLLDSAEPLLAGRRLLVTAGPTHEHLDPIRYLTNRSSGRQGYAIAAAAAAAGADVILVSGPTSLPVPPRVSLIRVETAEEMLAAVESSLPVDVAVMAAAVGDWRAPEPSASKLKKSGNGETTLHLIPNPDILKHVGIHLSARPGLVIGFAAETHNLSANAHAKREAKSADWIVANDVSGEGGAMGGEDNEVELITANGAFRWPRMSKQEVARRLVAKIAEEISGEARR